MHCFRTRARNWLRGDVSGSLGWNVDESAPAAALALFLGLVTDRMQVDLATWSCVAEVEHAATVSR